MSVSGGALASRNCSSIEGVWSLSLGKFLLRGAAGLMEAGAYFWGSSRCAGLLDRGREEAVSRGAPAVQGRRIDGENRLIRGDFPLRGAARWREEEACFW